MDCVNVIFQSLDINLPFFSASAKIEVQSRSDGTLQVDVPVDMITTFNMCSLLDAPTYLRHFTFSPPADPARLSSHREEIAETTIWFFRQTSDLQHLGSVTMTLDMPETGLVLRLMQRLPRLRTLELQLPTFVDYNSQHEGDRRSLTNEIEFAIEGFQELEEVVVPTALATGTLAELLDRMFDSKAALPGSRIRYSRRARNLLHVPTT